MLLFLINILLQHSFLVVLPVRRHFLNCAVFTIRYCNRMSEQTTDQVPTSVSSRKTDPRPDQPTSDQTLEEGRADVSSGVFTIDKTAYTIVKEGKAEVLFPNSHDVFYNPVQEFNRDLRYCIWQPCISRIDVVVVNELN